MSGTMPQPSPQPPPAAGAPRPGVPPALAGATAGMGQPPQGNPLQAKFQVVISGARELIQALSRAPGVDQAKLQQAVQMLQQGMQLIAAAVGKQQGQ